MSAEMLREAVRRIRHDLDFDQQHGDPAFLEAVADWLDATAARHDDILSNFATGSRAGAATAAENVTACAQALATAAAYLGAAS